MKKTERWLQEHIKENLEKSGFWVGHLSPPNHPGWPDLTAIRGTAIRSIEVKDFSKISDGRAFEAIFQPSQPPFFIEMLKHEHAVTVIGIDGDDILQIEMSTLSKIMDIFEMNKRDYLDSYAVPFSG